MAQMCEQYVKQQLIPLTMVQHLIRIKLFCGTLLMHLNILAASQHCKLINTDSVMLTRASLQTDFSTLAPYDSNNLVMSRYPSMTE